MTDHTKISLSKKICFILIVISFTFICLEFIIGLVSNIDEIRKASNTFHSQVESLKLYSKFYKPNQKLVLRCEWRPEGTKYFSPDDPIKFFTDSNGYISVSYDYVRKKSKDKIIFVGGSTTECNEVDEEFRFPFLVGEILDKKYNLHYDTLNAGVRGHTTQDSINLLLYLHRYQNPRYIILLHNINDMSWLKHNLSYIVYPQKLSINESITQFIDYLKFKSNLLFLITRSLGKIGLISERYPGDHRPPKYMAEILQKQREQTRPEELYRSFSLQFEKNLDIFIEICRIHEIKPILMTQPLGKDDTEHKMFNQLIRNVSEKLKVPLIDMDKLMPRNRDNLFFPDNIHLNNEGSIIVANIIAKELIEIIKNKGD